MILYKYREIILIILIIVFKYNNIINIEDNNILLIIIINRLIKLKVYENFVAPTTEEAKVLCEESGGTYLIDGTCQTPPAPEDEVEEIKCCECTNNVSDQEMLKFLGDIYGGDSAVITEKALKGLNPPLGQKDPIEVKTKLIVKGNITVKGKTIIGKNHNGENILKFRSGNKFHTTPTIFYFGNNGESDVNVGSLFINTQDKTVIRGWGNLTDKINELKTKYLDKKKDLTDLTFNHDVGLTHYPVENKWIKMPFIGRVNLGVKKGGGLEATGGLYANGGYGFVGKTGHCRVNAARGGTIDCGWHGNWSNQGCGSHRCWLSYMD
jgi:hypothetical protein